MRSGPVRYGPVRYGPVRYGPVRYGPVRYGPTTAAPTTLPPAEGGVTTIEIDDLAAEVAPAVSPGQVAQFRWGGRPNELGLSDKGFGPCCFGMTAGGDAVVLDTANLRLITASADMGGRVVAQWEANDFVPDAMVVAPAPRDEVIFVLGQTNRPGRPHDLISLRLDGTVISSAPRRSSSRTSRWW